MTDISQDQSAEAEASRRRDQVVKRMLATPPMKQKKGASQKASPQNDQAKR
jgi:hypothetical protein